MNPSIPNAWYEQIYSLTNGRYFPEFGGECVAFAETLLITYYNGSVVPCDLACDLAEKKQTNGILTFMDSLPPESTQLYPGDVVVWAAGGNANVDADAGHVAVYNGTDNGLPYFLGQNQGGRLNVSTQYIPLEGIIGIFRPKKVTVNSKTYGWKKIGADWYFEDGGQYASGWKEIYGVWYWFLTSNNVMWSQGWIQINGRWYYFDHSGAMKTGWLHLNGKTYYLDPNDGGAMVTGTHVIDGVSYTFNSNGELIS